MFRSFLPPTETLTLAAVKGLARSDGDREFSSRFETLVIPSRLKKGVARGHKAM